MNRMLPFMIAGLFSLLGSPLRGAEASPEKTAVPRGAALEKAQARIKEIFRDELADSDPDRLRKLAKTLLDRGIATEDAPVASYALLREAEAVYGRLDDLPGVLYAIEALSWTFAVDRLRLRAEALAGMAESISDPAQVMAVAGQALILASDAFVARDADLTADAAQLAERAARDAGDAELRSYVASRCKVYRMRARELERLAHARRAVAEKPGDAGASSMAGRILCFVLGEWEQGLPYLATGSDAALTQTAALDLRTGAGAVTSSAAIATGDAWWDLMEEEDRARTKRQLGRRALYWYEKAAAKLPGLDRLALEKKMGSFRREALPPAVECLLGPVVRPGGLRLGENTGAGSYVALVHEGKPCVQMVKRNPKSTKRLHLGFFVDDTWADVMKGSAVDVEIEYWDAAPGRLLVEYDAAGDAFTPAPAAITLTGGGTEWKTATVRCPKPLFHNRQVRGADFRLTQMSPTMYVRRVTVKRVEE